MTLRSLSYCSILLLSSLLTATACSAPGGTGSKNSGSNSKLGGDGDGDGNGSGLNLGGDGDGDPSGNPGDEEPDCDRFLEIIVRDFERSHPDFGGVPYSTGQEGDFIGDEVRRQLVEPDLGVNKKPVFLDPAGCAVQDTEATPVDNCLNWSNIPETLTNATNFAQWYLDTDGINYSFDKVLELSEEVAGSGVYVYDSSDFFPLSVDEGFGAVTGDASDNITPGKNFLFTTEIHLLFDYVAGQKFTFRGDDDLWVFVNNKLALDLGSMHGPKKATIDFDAQAEALGIQVGKAYEMDIFHAERRWNGSNFRIETNISCFVPNTDTILR